ncbi:UNVERIFIED_CONTAM: hypothetical protein ABIC26_002887 [Paenibacillus sp. PvR008]
MGNLMNKYSEWRKVSEQMLEDGFSGSVDCGESIVRDDFSQYAKLESTISFDDMFAIELEYDTMF